MDHEPIHLGSFTEPSFYLISVKGVISKDLSIILGGMNISHDNSDTESITHLSGLIKDQSELMGILNTLSNHHAMVLSVNKVAS